MLATRFVSLLLVTALPAQVLLVDINNGPGTNFTSLAAATAAAPDGATLIVLPGAYAGPVVVVGKGLTILGGPGVQIASGGLRIDSTLASQPNTVRAIAVAGSTVPFGPVAVFACQGRVLLENVAAATVTAFPNPPPAVLTVVGSPQVGLRGCTFDGGATVLSSHLSAEGCTFLGLPAFFSTSMMVASWAGRPAFLVGSGATVQLADCTAQGGAGACHPLGCGPTGPSPLLMNQPALAMNGGTAIVRAPGSLSGGATFAQGPSITGAGTVRIDPAITINGAIAVAPPAQIAPMPSMRSTSAGLGGTITATANGASGTLLLLLLGLPGPPLSVPGIADPFWMDPASHLYAAIGTTQPLTASLSVPVSQPLRGFAVAWQTVSFDPASGLLASQPSFALVF